MVRVHIDKCQASVSAVVFILPSIVNVARELDICDTKCERMYCIQIIFLLKQLHSMAAHKEINSYLIKARNLQFL